MLATGWGCRHDQYVSIRGPSGPSPECPIGLRRASLSRSAGARGRVEWAETAAAFHVSERTVWKWVARYLARYLAVELSARRDAQSRPHASLRPTAPAPERRILVLRTQRQSEPRIADRLSLTPSTVAGALRSHGLGRLLPLTPPPPIIRYERERPGALLHVDNKQLGRIEPGTIGRCPPLHPAHRRSDARAARLPAPARAPVRPAHQRQSRAPHPDRAS